MNKGTLFINNLNKSFNIDNKDIEILKDINFKINEGEFVVIVGHSGCGKSTLLKIIAGLITEYNGNVILDGEVICRPDKERAMIFQEHRLFPWLTIRDNISLGLDKGNKEENDKLIKDHLKMVKLEEFENAYPNQLSGGMSQRAAIARALINNPKLLLLYEPFGALDALTKIQLQNEILKIWQKEKTTMIMVTHDIEEAIYLADKIIVMSSRPGKIKEIINVDISKPRDRSSYDFATIKKRVYKHFFDTEDISIEYTI